MEDEQLSHVVDETRAGLTIWWALRTHNAGAPWKARRRRGREGWEGCPLPNQLGVWGALHKLLGVVPKTDLVKFEIEKYITDDKDFGNFKKTVTVKMTCQPSTDNDF